MGDEYVSERATAQVAPDTALIIALQASFPRPDDLRYLNQDCGMYSRFTLTIGHALIRESKSHVIRANAAAFSQSDGRDIRSFPSDEQIISTAKLLWGDLTAPGVLARMESSKDSDLREAIHSAWFEACSTIAKRKRRSFGEGFLEMPNELAHKFPAWSAVYDPKRATMERFANSQLRTHAVSAEAARVLHLPPPPGAPKIIFTDETPEPPGAGADVADIITSRMAVADLELSNTHEALFRQHYMDQTPIEGAKAMGISASKFRRQVATSKRKLSRLFEKG